MAFPTFLKKEPSGSNAYFRIYRQNLAIGAFVLFLLGFAFFFCHRATTGLTWAPLFDMWRDVGLAQTLLDGQYPADPVYAGAVSWYNPTMGFVVAGISKVTGWPPALVDVRIGAYINLLTPLAFFVLTACLFDKWTALAALVFFLFGNPLQRGSVQSWSPWMYNTPTYSPWFWASHFAQFFFFCALASFWQAYKSRQWRWYGISGVLLGLTFMTHTAPALIFGGVSGVVMAGGILVVLVRRFDWKKAGQMVGQYGMLLVIAFVVSLPYSLPILVKYRFHMENLGPSLYTDPYYYLEHLRSFLWDRVTISNLFAIIGLGGLIVMRDRGVEKALLLLWLGIGGGFLVYSFIVKSHPQLPPQIMPPHHFMMSVGGVKTVLTGAGAILVARGLLAWLKRRSWAVWLGDGSGQWVAVGVMCLVLMPFYPSWDMLTRTRDREAYGAEFVHIQGAYGWIVAHTDPGDVFLCDQVLACQVVSPAGRKLVSIMSIFANPYESDALRPVTRDEMLNAIKTNDESKFHLLMERFHPKYVLVRDEDVAACDQRPYLRSLFRSGNIGIYEILSKRV